MDKLDQQLRLHPDVVETELDGDETVLLHLDSKLYYTLNPTGTRIWRGIKDHLTLREISQGLQREFEVEPDVAERSVLRLVDELRQRSLLEEVK